jgi:phosphatidylserine/phosphatidylglycerophosphate/cardiolipin synthase-like enzyme
MASDDSILALSDSDLHEIASAFRTGRLVVPATEVGLGRMLGMSATAGVTAALQAWIARGLNAEQIAWTIDLLLRSRQRQQRPEELLELVLTGPETAGTPVRDTAAVVHELFAQAEYSVMVIGYAIHKGQRVFKALAERMLTVPQLSVRMFFDIQLRPAGTQSPNELVSAFVQRFKNVEWPEGYPMPHVFFYPASLDAGDVRSCLHAKCVIVDRRVVFVSSANFTEAAQERNIEAGVLIRSPFVASRLADHFEALVQREMMRQII